MATKKAKDLAPKKPSVVKGGRKAGGSQQENHNFTLVRHAKPAVKKDLPPSKNPKGGRAGSKHVS